MKLVKIKTQSQFKKCKPLILQLHKSAHDWTNSNVKPLKIFKKTNYKLFALQYKSKYVALIGFRMIPYLAFKGKSVLFLEDFVVHQKYQHNGIGSALLSWTKQYADEHDCVKIELISSKSRYKTAYFYRKNNFQSTSYSFSFQSW